MFVYKKNHECACVCIWVYYKDLLKYKCLVNDFLIRHDNFVLYENIETNKLLFSFIYGSIYKKKSMKDFKSICKKS